MSSNDRFNYWDEKRGRITSKNGGWFPGKGMFRYGHDMMNELVGNISYMQMVILNVTGEIVEKRLADWIEALFIGLSCPDQRLWCNHVGALSGAMNTTSVSATVAGILTSDSKIYGPTTLLSGMDFIQQAVTEYEQGRTIEEIVESRHYKGQDKPTLMGYSRPLANGDERIAAMDRVSEQLGYQRGSHVQLAYRIEAYMVEHYSERMNINGLCSAFLSDEGITPEHGCAIISCMVSSGVTASYLETIDKPATSFLPMRCEDIAYTGPELREVPEKAPDF